MKDKLSSNCCEIYLIRHGETDWNLENRLQGQTDIPLNEKGIAQAIELKEKLAHIDFTVACSSDLLRACKTAYIVLKGRKIDIIESPLLRERTLGIWEGCLGSELTDWVKENFSTSTFSKEQYFQNRFSEDMETLTEVYQRLTKFITEISRLYAGYTILMSSHAGILVSVLYHIDYQAGFRWRIDNCGWLKLQAKQDGEIQLLKQSGAHQHKYGAQ